MPVYNSGIYLKTAVESILSQSLSDFELILVDDGSTDGSSEKCDNYAKIDPRVVVVHKRNGGICNARNVALMIARGEYIAFSDHDDEYLPGLLEETYKRAVSDDADIVKFCKKELIMSDGVVLRTRETKMQNTVLRGVDVVDNYLPLMNQKILDCVWDSLFRRNLIIENNIYFDEKYKAGGEDIDFITRLMPHVKVFSLVNRVFYLHYIRTGFSTSAKYSPVKFQTYKMLAERITIGANNLGVDLYKYKEMYLYQISFTLINQSVSLLSNQQCNLSKKDKFQYLIDIRKEPYLPDWFFRQSALSISRISKRYALVYFLYCHGMYYALFWITNWRNIQLSIKRVLRGRQL